MALGLHSIVVVILCATSATCVFAGDDGCKAYRDSNNVYHSPQQCIIGFCCGTCKNRQCCFDPYRQLNEDQQENCDTSYSYSSSPPVVPVIVVSVIVFTVVFTLFCCCICPCCCLYSLCHKPRPVVATTHTTVVTSVPQQYPQGQPTAMGGVSQPYQGTPYPPYQPMPVQPGYGTQAMSASPYQGQPYPPLPTYQDATGPAYPPQPMPYSQAAYGPGQPAYPLQPPVQPQPNAPPSQMDFLSQPAFNPDYVVPPKTG